MARFGEFLCDFCLFVLRQYYQNCTGEHDEDRRGNEPSIKPCHTAVRSCAGGRVFDISTSALRYCKVRPSVRQVSLWYTRNKDTEQLLIESSSTTLGDPRNGVPLFSASSLFPSRMVGNSMDGCEHDRDMFSITKS